LIPPSVREPTVPLRPLPYYAAMFKKGKGLRETVGFLDAKHLDAGIPLEPSLPLQLGNTLEEHD
jgi:hypothetical protein